MRAAGRMKWPAAARRLIYINSDLWNPVFYTGPETCFYQSSKYSTVTTVPSMMNSLQNFSRQNPSSMKTLYKFFSWSFQFSLRISTAVPTTQFFAILFILKSFLGLGYSFLCGGFGNPDRQLDNCLDNYINIASVHLIDVFSAYSPVASIFSNYHATVLSFV